MRTVAALGSLPSPSDIAWGQFPEMKIMLDLCFYESSAAGRTQAAPDHFLSPPLPSAAAELLGAAPPLSSEENKNHWKRGATGERGRAGFQLRRRALKF